MVDYTKPKTGLGRMGFYVAAGIVVLILLFAIFSGGGTSTSEPTSLSAPTATETEPAITDGTVEGN